MSNKSEQERERLKEEYKDHYRKIRDTKEKLRRSKYVQNVNEALNQMNTDELLSSVDHFLGNVRDKMSHIEARLDVAMEGFLESDEEQEIMDEELRKEHARESLKQIKLEMGLLYSEIEEQAREMKIDKTVGRGKEPDPKPSNSEADQE
tara:strand:- start:22223 stop:22669 length:447 start_codon:yes stop_codon:yes gene_type:complete